MRRKLVRRILVLVVLIQVVLPLAVYAFRSHLMFFPSTATTPAQVLAQLHGDGLTAAVITATRPDGRRLVGLDVRPGGVATDGPVVLYFHGNAGSVATRWRWLRAHAQAMGTRVVLASYSGYGGNAGSPSADEIQIDALAWYDHLAYVEGVAAARIVVHGRSMGGAAALAVAGARPVAGVVTQSAFSSLRSMAWRNYGWVPLACLLTGNELDNASIAAAVRVPLLIVHGTRDRVVPFPEGEILAAAAQGAEFIAIEGGTHNRLDEYAGESLSAPVRAFIGRSTGR